jgi:glycogen debranching enzyme
MNENNFLIHWLLILFPLFQIAIQAQQSVNVNGKNVVPEIKFPGITQTDFQDAFNVLDECLVKNVPVDGFVYPFMYPGGAYGKTWWQLDGSLTLSGSKWADQSFAENVLRNFIAVQKPDGRIPLYGPDMYNLDMFDTASSLKCSSLPKLFEVAYDVLSRSNDTVLVRDTYNCLKKYLDWWLSYSVRRDSLSGLITGVFEESFPSDETYFFIKAPVDLNVEVAVGCANVAKLANQLRLTADYKKYSNIERLLKNSINNYMWDKTTGAYYSYLVIEKKIDKRLICYTFDPFKLSIAPQNRIQKMVQMLIDNKYFNWNSYAITSAAKTCPGYNETVGIYNGPPAWTGDIWSLRNETVIQGLEDIGRYDLSSHLALKTVMLFNAKNAEFIKPSDGSGQGQPRYGWSASQYIQIIIEKIFGIDYNNFTRTITIMPRLDEELTGKNISLDSLLLPNGNRLNLSVSDRTEGVSVKYNITGRANDMNIILALPAYGKITYTAVDFKNRKLILKKFVKGSAKIYQFNNGIKPSGELIFIPK